MNNFIESISERRETVSSRTFFWALIFLFISFLDTPFELTFSIGIVLTIIHGILYHKFIIGKYFENFSRVHIFYRGKGCDLIRKVNKKSYRVYKAAIILVIAAYLAAFFGYSSYSIFQIILTISGLMALFTPVFFYYKEKKNFIDVKNEMIIERDKPKVYGAINFLIEFYSLPELCFPKSHLQGDPYAKYLLEKKFLKFEKIPRSPSLRYSVLDKAEKFFEALREEFKKSVHDFEVFQEEYIKEYKEFEEKGSVGGFLEMGHEIFVEVLGSNR